MTFGILGSGSWGTALAKILTDNHNSIYWWNRSESAIEQLKLRHHNPQYLQSAHLNIAKMELTSDAETVIKNSDIIVIAIPSAYAAEVLSTLDKNCWFLLPNIIYKKASTFQDRFRAILGEHTFSIENEKGSREWDWSEFSTWIESPHFFHLYFNSRSFFIIPKEAFEGDDEHAARRILTAKIKK